jgi:hypothetical protein
MRNCPNIYPSGAHIENTAIAMGRERVHRAALAVSLLKQHYPQAVVSLPGAADLGIPEL